MTAVHSLRSVLVTGATGRQGGAVARRLLRDGFPVRALVRDPQKPAARELARLDAELVRGDLEDRASVERAVEEVHGVFSVQNFFQAGYEGEIRQGITLAEAAKAAGVAHFVYSSVGGSYRETGITHFESKRRIEERIRDLELPCTILRPTFFMHNWEGSRERILGGTFATPLAPDRTLQQLAVEDLGAFAARAFASPEEWIGRELELAADEPSMAQMAETFGRVTGWPVSYVRVPWEEFREKAGEEVASMYRWFEEEGYEAEMGTLREEYPELTTFGQYLRAHGWEGAAERR